jgi:hypothetical protein
MFYIIFDNVSSNKYFKKPKNSYTQHARLKERKKERKKERRKGKGKDGKKIQSTRKQQVRVNEKLRGEGKKEEQCSRL